MSHSWLSATLGYVSVSDTPTFKNLVVVGIVHVFVIYTNADTDDMVSSLHSTTTIIPQSATV